MRYTSQLLMMIFITAFISSCSDDSTNPSDSSAFPTFSIEEGDVWYYDRNMIEDNETTTFASIEVHALEPTIIAEEKCFKQVQVDAGESIEGKPFHYSRTDNDGFYVYYEEFLEDYTSYFPELNNTWVQQISFTEDKLTVFDLEKDTLDKFENPYKINLTYMLEHKGKTTVEYKGESVIGYKTQLNILVVTKGTFEGQEYKNIDDRGSEMIYIPDVGVYRIQGIREGIFKDNYDILTDHK